MLEKFLVGVLTAGILGVISFVAKKSEEEKKKTIDEGRNIKIKNQDKNIQQAGKDNNQVVKSGKWNKFIIIVLSLFISSIIIGPILIAFEDSTNDYIYLLFYVVWFIVAFIWIKLYEKRLAKEINNIYSCPDCHEDIKLGQKKCKHCGCKLDWSDVEK